LKAYIESRGKTHAPLLIQAAEEAVPHLTYLAPLTIMMVVTNFDEQFSAELGAALLNDEQQQDTLLNKIIQTAKRLQADTNRRAMVPACFWVCNGMPIKHHLNLAVYPHCLR
jgi:hypothetical protein